MKPILVEVVEELTMENMWEHRPVDFYKYGEYPRYLSQPHSRTRTEVRWVEDE